MECLDTLIGLSQTTCSCYDPLPPGYNDSDSGVFIDEAKGFNLDAFDYANDCKQGSIWDILSKSRNLAKTELQNDLNKFLSADTKNKYSSCKGLLISTKKQGTSLTTDFIGIEITPECNESTCLNITNLGLLASSAGNINWSIYSNQDLTAPLYSGSFAVVGAGVNNQDVSSENINLDLSCEGCIDLKYYLVYELNGVTTYSNKIWCKPCTGKDACTKPFYEQNGIGGTLIADIETWTNTGNLANGIVYSGEVVCEVDLCDYLISKKNPLYGWIVTAYQMKSAEYAYYTVIKGGDFSRYTTIDLDCLQSTLIDYKTWYDEAMQYVSQEIVKQGHPCLVCDSPMQKRLIGA